MIQFWFKRSDRKHYEILKIWTPGKIAVITIMILSFRTGKPGPSADPDQTAPRGRQSDQGLHCLQFQLHLLEALLYGKALFFKF